LNNAFRLYGKDVFTVVLLKTCPLEEMDKWEQHYIAELNTLYPNGYNLTKGGKTARFKAIANDVTTPTLTLAGPRGGCKHRTTATRELISKRIKATLNTDSVRTSIMKRTQIQHNKQKIERFRGLIIDMTNLEQYISTKHIAGHLAAIVKVDDKKASFVGKYETIETLKERARTFLKEINS
jgi:hypothetical protein